MKWTQRPVSFAKLNVFVKDNGSVYLTDRYVNTLLEFPIHLCSQIEESMELFTETTENKCACQAYMLCSI